MTESVDPTVVALFLPFFGALVAPVCVRFFGHRAAWFLALVPLLAFLHFAALLPQIAGRETVAGGFDWAPSLGLRLSWLLDGLSVTFALLITGIGTLIVLYTGGYLKGHPHLGRFFSFIFLFMGSMLGVVVSDNFLMLFVFWELTSITSFLLIGFDHEREASRRAALQALVVTGGGGLALLAGLLVVSVVTGASQMSDLAANAALLRSSPFYLAALVLILGGAFTKSAQFPFHFWLPNAMEAPTPVSAYLHSATMVKAGVYLLMRLNPVMGGTAAWETLLPAFGAATLVVGAVLAVRQTDLKLQLAYTTVSSLGLLVMLTGFGTPLAVEAAVLYLVAHALFKGALFMVAGIIDHETGTRDITRLGGLRAAMPATFAVALLRGRIDGWPAAVLRFSRQGGSLCGAPWRRCGGACLHPCRRGRQCADVCDRFCHRVEAVSRKNRGDAAPPARGAAAADLRPRASCRPRARSCDLFGADAPLYFLADGNRGQRRGRANLDLARAAYRSAACALAAHHPCRDTDLPRARRRQAPGCRSAWLVRPRPRSRLRRRVEGARPLGAFGDAQAAAGPPRNLHHRHVHLPCRDPAGAAGPLRGAAGNAVFPAGPAMA